MKAGKRTDRLADHMMLIGFCLAVVYWVLDSILSIFTSYDNWFEQLLGVNLDEVWTRIIVLCLFAIFGSHAQYTINERKKAEAKLERDAATRERFQRLLSPDLAERVVSGELKVEKGGKDRVATVLFVDIRGFTTISENNQASAVLRLLNEYYEVLVEVVFRHEGTVDKFIGDAMMVIWGAPVLHDNDPHRAVRAALDMHAALAEFNRKSLETGRPKITIGIGINTGNLMAGYIGSSHTMSYSVIGDTVNTASRLCSSAQPGQILVSDHTWRMVQDRFEASPIGRIQTKGKFKPVNAFAVTGEKPPAL
ncbi:adenylate/guanylate cyclase domain-containing protein [Desulfosarcina sp.]|uniref:adenylate/guanylate cyclase domain-containing protein n=1 Tax=Desulfosarcina sp. TaxID=2027861 RepID=UPI00397083C3